MLSSNNNRSPTNTMTKIDLVAFCSFLSLSKQIDIFSMLLSLLVVFVALLSSSAIPLTIICLMIFILGLISKYYAIRIEFDRKLFKHLTNHVDHLHDELLAMDRALANLKLIKPSQFTSRTIADRQKGVLSLLKKQIILFLAQNCLIIFAFINVIIND